MSALVDVLPTNDPHDFDAIVDDAIINGINAAYASSLSCPDMIDGRIEIGCSAIRSKRRKNAS
jgi:hypothetical protein